MVFLLDTNVISELRRRRPHGGVLAWIEAVPDAGLFVSAVSIGEIQAGVEATRARDPVKANEIEIWLERVEANFNVLPMDARAFRIWARLMHGKPDHLIEDAMIAATALVHGLTVATRNIADFALFGAPTVDPFRAPK